MTRRYDTTRATAVMGFLRQPRTRAEVLARFDGDKAALYAVWNLRKRGLVEAVQVSERLYRWRVKNGATEPAFNDGGAALMDAWASNA